MAITLNQMLSDAKSAQVDTTIADEMVSRFYEGYLEPDNQWKVKKSFAPSGLFYGSGACAKRWFLSFKGTEFASKAGPLNYAIMKHGTASHERIQEAMLKSGAAQEVEKVIRLQSPPIFGYADVILEHDGLVYVGEIKTTGHQNFEYRRKTNKIAQYHLAQVLLYAHILGIPRGVVIYESRETLELHAITFEVTEELAALAESILNWCKEVWALHEANTMPKRSFRKGSKVCKSCPVEVACNKEDGDVKVERLSIES